MSKKEWPPSSSDLNPLDQQHLVRARKQDLSHRSLESLEAKLSTEWDKISKSVIRDTYKLFSKRLQQVVDAESNCIE